MKFSKVTDDRRNLTPQSLFAPIVLSKHENLEGNCVVVVDLLLNDNMLTGKIPGSLFRLKNLTTLDLSKKLLACSILVGFGDSIKLQGLYLGNNQLIGTIPGTLGRLGSLVKLNLTSNKLSSVVPTSFGNLKELTHLDLSHNDLTVSYLFHCPKCLTWNKFIGDIPSEIGNLMQQEYFNVSGNKLYGQIPEKVSRLYSPVYLNLAENRLGGLVPRNGICQKLSKNFLGNNDLHGRIMGLECQIRSFDISSLLNAWGLVGIVVASLFIIFISAFALRRWIMRSDPEEIEESKLNNFLDQNLCFWSSSRLKEPLSINIAMFEQPLLKLTLGDILEGTVTFARPT
ncbi:hypothetical protein REPUB_Repub11eG0079000 [Reevesia pubescens]